MIVQLKPLSIHQSSHVRKKVDSFKSELIFIDIDGYSDAVNEGLNVDFSDYQYYTRNEIESKRLKYVKMKIVMYEAKMLHNSNNIKNRMLKPSSKFVFIDKRGKMHPKVAYIRRGL